MALWFDETYAGKIRFGLKLKRSLYQGKSEFQSVDVVETEEFGRALALEDAWMTSERATELQGLDHVDRLKLAFALEQTARKTQTEADLAAVRFIEPKSHRSTPSTRHDKTTAGVLSVARGSTERSSAARPRALQQVETGGERGDSDR